MPHAARQLPSWLTSDVGQKLIVSAKKLNLKAELLWASVSPQMKEAILKAVWCSHCRSGVAILDYAVGEDRGDVILRGKCAVCGGPVARLVETSEAPRESN